MWFVFSVLALFFWSGSDLFSKIGCADSADRYSHLKMVTDVGIVMGLHAAYEIFIGGTEMNAGIILTYLPVSMLYIVSMAIGYLGLRYIELSISSPVCNSSGALVAVITLAADGADGFAPLQLIAVAVVAAGVVSLGITEAREDEALREARRDSSNWKYTGSRAAFIIPVIYCLIDALGTFADSRVLMVLDEAGANAAYELTFFAAGAVSAAYVYGAKKQKAVLKQEIPKFAGAVCETAGQFAYIYALADSSHVALAAPIISSYCVLSVVWSRIFLREKLSAKHYISIAATAAGIITLGIFDA